jgi:hypothetical protein
VNSFSENSENINRIFINPTHNIHHRMSSKFIANENVYKQFKNVQNPVVQEPQPMVLKPNIPKKTSNKPKLIQMKNKRFLD